MGRSLNIRPALSTQGLELPLKRLRCRQCPRGRSSTKRDVAVAAVMPCSHAVSERSASRRHAEVSREIIHQHRVRAIRFLDAAARREWIPISPRAGLSGGHATPNESFHPASVVSKRQILDQHVIPALGRMPLDSILSAPAPAHPGRSRRRQPSRGKHPDTARQGWLLVPPPIRDPAARLGECGDAEGSALRTEQGQVPRRPRLAALPAPDAADEPRYSLAEWDRREPSLGTDGPAQGPPQLAWC